MQLYTGNAIHKLRFDWKYVFFTSSIFDFVFVLFCFAFFFVFVFEGGRGMGGGGGVGGWGNEINTLGTCYRFPHP